MLNTSRRNILIFLRTTLGWTRISNMNKSFGNSYKLLSIFGYSSVSKHFKMFNTVTLQHCTIIEIQIFPLKFPKLDVACICVWNNNNTSSHSNYYVSTKFTHKFI